MLRYEHWFLFFRRVPVKTTAIFVGLLCGYFDFHFFIFYQDSYFYINSVIFWIAERVLFIIPLDVLYFKGLNLI